MAKPVERGLGLVRAVARQEFDVFNRHEQLVAGEIMQLQTVMRRARRLDLLEADETPDAVIDMDDEIARRQRRDFGEEIGAAFFAAALGREAVAQNILLADHRQIAGDKAGFEPDYRQRHAPIAQRQRLRQRGHRLQLLQPMFGEDRPKPLARAVAPARDDNFLALALQGADVLDRGLEHIGVFVLALGRKIAAGNAAAIDHGQLAAFGRGEGRELRRRLLGQPFREFLGRKIKLVGRQRLVIAMRGVLRKGRAARVVIILDLGETLGRGALDLGIEQQRRVADVIEQAVELVVQQRHPVIEPAGTAAFAHRFIEHVAARLGAEQGDVFLAEALDRLAGDRRFIDRHEIERPQLPGGALAFRVEGADGLQNVAKKVEPHRGRQARRIKIDNAAAQGIFAALPHSGGAQKSVGVEPKREGVEIDGGAGRGRKTLGRHLLERRNPLGQRGDGGDEQARFFERGACARQPRQRRHALCGDRRRRRHAIIGLAVPGREFEDFRFRRGEGEGFTEGAQALAVAGHMDQRARPPLPGPSRRAEQDRRRRRSRTRPARAKKSASGFFQARQGRVAVFSCCFYPNPCFSPESLVLRRPLSGVDRRPTGDVSKGEESSASLFQLLASVEVWPMVRDGPIGPPHHEGVEAARSRLRPLTNSPANDGYETP